MPGDGRENPGLSDGAREAPMPDEREAPKLGLREALKLGAREGTKLVLRDVPMLGTREALELDVRDGPKLDDRLNDGLREGVSGGREDAPARDADEPR